MKDNAYKMIEEGDLRSEICAQLGISAVDYREIKSEGIERKESESDEMQEFHKLKVRVHKRCRMLLIRLTEDVKQYCEPSTVEEIERIQEMLPLANDKEALQAHIEMLREKEKDIETATLKAGESKIEKELKTFKEELKEEEARRLRSLDKYAEQQGLSLNEKMKMARRIRRLYYIKEV